MKQVILAVLFLAELAYSISAKKLPNKSIFIAVQDYLNKKCASENYATKNFTDILIGMDSCVDPYVPATPEEMRNLARPRSFNDICDGPEKLNKIRECFQPAIDVLVLCGNDNEKYLPNFVSDAIENVYNFICADDRKNIEKLYKNSTMACLDALRSDRRSLNICEEEGDSLIAVADDGIITKTELCNGVEEQKTCYLDYIKNKCPEDSNFREVVEDFIDALAVSCSR